MIYFDAAAAAPPDPAVLDFQRETALRRYANQEAAHGFARALRREMEEAAQKLARLLADDSYRVLWGASGTDLFQAFAALPEWRGQPCFRDLVHPALAAALRETMRPAAPGSADPPRLLAASHIESETGRRLDMETFRAAAPAAPLLADTIQSVGKEPLPRADFLTVSGHKLGAPAAALLYRDPDGRRSECFRELRHRDYRFGRPDPASVLTLVFAVERACARMEENRRRVEAVNRYLRETLPAVPLRGGHHPVPTLPPEAASPYILHFLLPGMQGAVVARMLSEQEIYVASGSACQAESDRPSAALLALGHSRAEAYSGLRLSFSPANTPEEAAAFLAAFRKIAQEY